ncbi:MAG: cryptochrome/photolyase family protein, partial [Planctomycetia bacterium]
RLSPHLAFGEVAPGRVRAAVLRTVAEAPPERRPAVRSAAESYLRQLAWRDFSWHLLYHFPHIARLPLQRSFPTAGRGDPRELRAWRRGRTGFPLVDAGMRQLWATGWMHNRVRMAAASFLTKHLLVDWTVGATWFWETLVDADLANNTMGWQWSAGCGTDVKFRMFDPSLQGRRFDVAGGYVRRWVPELAAVPTEYLHAPWEAPGRALRAAGVTLGVDYPEPIVDHSAARRRALAFFRAAPRDDAAGLFPDE